MSTSTQVGRRARGRARGARGVAGLTDHLEVRALEQAGEPFAKKDVVVRENQPEGSHR